MLKKYTTKHYFYILAPQTKITFYEKIVLWSFTGSCYFM
ncbi:hypothetical protein BCF58_2492 [Chryseobacterium defluvii]|uniref:Uncharacterized protein n=1 Tax=Chryseobacterium defluvii TaxID=160396 RepID=A0A495S8D2_9FLAO|nr:hypothetical protein BCF58_2492 [Chryseobacterium defluvii]